MTCVQSGWGEGTCPDCNKPPNDHFMCPDCIVTCFCGRKKCGIYCRFNIHTQSSINKHIIQGLTAAKDIKIPLRIFPSMTN